MFFDIIKHSIQMKNLKLNLALLAMVVGCTFAFAFKAPAKRAFVNLDWQYTNSLLSPTDPAAYTQVPMPPTCPTGNTNICYIEAPADPAHSGEPKISSALSTRISNLDTTQGDVFTKH
jgi:hypothetical protein